MNQNKIATVAEDGSINVVDLNHLNPANPVYGSPAACVSSCNLNAVQFIEPEKVHI